MTTALDDYDLPFHNASGETIPPFAVMQQTWQGAIADRDYFRAIKPNGIGKKFALNGPLPIPAGGQGRGTIARGSFALYDPSIIPAADEELGPLPGQWHLGRLGSGFIVDGEIAGSPPSLPGFPTVASTLRVRVTIQPAAGKSEQLIRFELKDDKTLPSPPFGFAYLLDDNDVKITGDNNQPLEIIVIDRLPTVYAGFGAYTDKKYGAQPGNRGWAQFKSGDYGGTGKLGYEIIAMDGQARFIEGTLAADWAASAQSGEIEVTNYWGAAPNNRPPKTFEKDYGGGGTGQASDKRNVVSVYDTLDLRSGQLDSGQRIRAVLDELRNKYLLIAVPGGASTSEAGLYKVTTILTAAAHPSTDVLVPGVGEAKRYRLVVDGNGDPELTTAGLKQWEIDADEDAVEILNSVATTVAVGKDIQAKPIDGYMFVDVENCG